MCLDKSHRSILVESLGQCDSVQSAQIDSTPSIEPGSSAIVRLLISMLYSLACQANPNQMAQEERSLESPNINIIIVEGNF